MSKIIEDFKEFQDAQGLQQLNPGEVSQNGSLFTVEYLITLLADDSSTEEEKKAEIERICKVLRGLEVLPGLTIRNWGSTEFESMDNTIAILTFSALFDEGRFAQRLELRGQNRTHGPDQSQDKEKNEKAWPWANALSLWRGPKNVWNNQNPNLFCLQGWFGRSPAMLGLIKMVQKKYCNPFLWLAVLVGQFLGCNAEPQNTDARKLNYVLWQFLKTRSLFWKMAYRVWIWTMMKKCPEGMKTVYEIYFKNPNHPMKKYAKPYID